MIHDRALQEKKSRYVACYVCEYSESGMAGWTKVEEEFAAVGDSKGNKARVDSILKRLLFLTPFSIIHLLIELRKHSWTLAVNGNMVSVSVQSGIKSKLSPCLVFVACFLHLLMRHLKCINIFSCTIYTMYYIFEKSIIVSFQQARL